jgi:hypothetical protein
LLREESEGYSKLVTELGQGANLSNGNATLQNIQSLIGCFNLDPNRVLDIILESFENSGAHMHGSFIELLRNYKAEENTVCQMMGFKYQSLHQLQETQQQETQYNENHQFTNTDTGLTEPGGKITQDSLYTVTAYLLKFKIIDLDLLLPHVIINFIMLPQR